MPVNIISNHPYNTPVNSINPQKLLNSKWTATLPRNKEKHFIICAVEFDEDGKVIFCEIEAIFSKRRFAIEWQDLKNSDHWLQGWK